MKTIHFNVVVRKDDVRVICWKRLFAYSVIGGLLFGCIFEYLRFLLDNSWSIASLLREIGLVCVGIGIVLLIDGLMKPIEQLDPFLHPRDDDEDVIEATDLLSPPRAHPSEDAPTTTTVQLAPQADKTDDEEDGKGEE